MSSVVFDIETGSLPVQELKRILPAFDPATLGCHPGVFDQSSVKLGNLKDEAKIAEKIESARLAHEDRVKAFESSLAGGEQKHWDTIQSKAALSAITGQVIAIGYKTETNDGPKSIIHGQGEQGLSEISILGKFWDHYAKFRHESRTMIGFNIKGFDIPFIVQRSIILGLSVPKSLFNQGRYLDSLFIDLRDVWGAGQWQPQGNLDAICKAARLGKKTDDVTGADFYSLWMNTETRDKAREYLLNDLEMTWSLAERTNCI